MENTGLAERAWSDHAKLVFLFSQKRFRFDYVSGIVLLKYQQQDYLSEIVTFSEKKWLGGGVCYILPLHLFRIRASFDYVRGSTAVPLRFYFGLLRFRSGSTPVSLRFHSGTTPVLLRFRSGSAPVPLRFHSGSAPVSLRFCSLYKGGLFRITLLSEAAVSRRERLQWSSLWLSLEARVSGRMRGRTWIVVVVRLDRNADMLYCLISVEWSFISPGI